MLHDHISCRSARRTALAAVLALSGATLGGCYSTGPVPVATTASVTATAAFPAGGAIKCVTSVAWTFSIQSVTGKSGSAATITRGPTMVEITPDANGNCTVSDSEIGMRAGTWRITVLLGIASNMCDTTLANGGNSKTFTYGMGGCS